jgi:hypothetical protein
MEATMTKICTLLVMILSVTSLTAWSQEKVDSQKLGKNKFCTQSEKISKTLADANNIKSYLNYEKVLDLSKSEHSGLLFEFFMVREELLEQKARFEKIATVYMVVGDFPLSSIEKDSATTETSRVKLEKVKRKMTDLYESVKGQNYKFIQLPEIQYSQEVYSEVCRSQK